MLPYIYALVLYVCTINSSCFNILHPFPRKIKKELVKHFLLLFFPSIQETNLGSTLCSQMNRTRLHTFYLWYIRTFFCVGGCQDAKLAFKEECLKRFPRRKRVEWEFHCRVVKKTWHFSERSNGMMELFSALKKFSTCLSQTVLPFLSSFLIK